MAFRYISSLPDQSGQFIIISFCCISSFFFFFYCPELMAFHNSIFSMRKNVDP